MQRISSQDRVALIRLASSLPSGSPQKRAILAGLGRISKSASGLFEMAQGRVTGMLQKFITKNQTAIEAWADQTGYGPYNPDLYGSQTQSDILRKLSSGWSEDDVYAYMVVSEEIDPRVSEGNALRIMRAISKKYPA